MKTKDIPLGETTQGILSDFLTFRKIGHRGVLKNLCVFPTARYIEHGKYKKKIGSSLKTNSLIFLYFKAGTGVSKIQRCVSLKRHATEM
jgi:hypothetical protein